MVPGRKFSATTSAVSISFVRISFPLGVCRFSETLFLPRDRLRMQKDISFGSVFSNTIPFGP